MKKKKGIIVFIFYEHLVREWDSVIRLKTELQKRGANVFVFSVMVEKNKAYFVATFHKPDVVFMPWLTSEPYEAIISPFVKLNPKVRIVDFHHEEITVPGGQSYFIPKTTYGKSAVFHIAWSEKFKSLLTENGVNSARVFVTGNIRTDLLKKKKISKEYLADKYKLDISKKWVLFAESRGYFQQRKTTAEIEQLKEDGVEIKKIKTRVDYEEKSYRAFFEDLDNISKDFTDEYELIYRPHPGTHSMGIMPSWVKVISERSISDWIDNVDFFLSCGSTSIYEAEINGIPCGIYNRYPIPKEWLIEGLERYPTVDSINEINVELINRIKKKTGHIYLSYMGIVDGHVADRICDMVESIMNPKYDETSEKYLKSVCKNSLYKATKIWIYEITAWILVKTSLIERIKKPNSIYLLINDIPYHKKNLWHIDSKQRIENAATIS